MPLINQKIGPLSPWWGEKNGWQMKAVEVAHEIGFTPSVIGIAVRRGERLAREKGHRFAG
jgi:hypothetical protein